MMTKKSETHRQRQEEVRQSRIRQTKAFIHNNLKSELINNQKWLKVFEYLEQADLRFQLKTLLLTESQGCERIRELGQTSIMIDDSGDFIEFLEIELLTFRKSEGLADFLDSLNVEYIDNLGYVEISGYRK